MKQIRSKGELFFSVSAFISNIGSIKEKNHPMKTIG
jgi:hypothetical protein